MDGRRNPGGANLREIMPIIGMDFAIGVNSLFGIIYGCRSMGERLDQTAAKIQPYVGIIGAGVVEYGYPLLYTFAMATLTSAAIRITHNALTSKCTCAGSMDRTDNTTLEDRTGT